MHAWKLTHFLIQLHRTLCTSAKSILSGCSAAIGSVRCGSNMHCVAAKKIKVKNVTSFFGFRPFGPCCCPPGPRSLV